MEQMMKGGGFGEKADIRTDLRMHWVNMKPHVNVFGRNGEKCRYAIRQGWLWGKRSLEGWSHSFAICTICYLHKYSLVNYFLEQNKKGAGAGACLCSWSQRLCCKSNIISVNFPLFGDFIEDFPFVNLKDDRPEIFLVYFGYFVLMMNMNIIKI